MRGKARRQTLLAAFGARVAQLRKGASFTQQELADACGLSRAAIANIEGGHSWVAIETLDRLANALRVHRSHLVSW